MLAITSLMSAVQPNRSPSVVSVQHNKDFYFTAHCIGNLALLQPLRRLQCSSNTARVYLRSTEPWCWPSAAAAAVLVDSRNRSGRCTTHDVSPIQPQSIWGTARPCIVQVQHNKDSNRAACCMSPGCSHCSAGSAAPARPQRGHMYHANMARV